MKTTNSSALAHSVPAGRMYDVPVPYSPVSAPAASRQERFTVYCDEKGREGLLVFTGGSLTGFRPHTDGRGNVHLGYLRPDGTEENMMHTEFRWINPALITAVKLLP